MEETSVQLLNQNNKYSDELIIEREIKLNCYHYYISSLFIDPVLRLKLLSIIYIDLELNKILKLNTENNILIVKFDWWKVACIESLAGKPFAVPILRVLKKLFYKNNLIKYKLLDLIKLFQIYALEKNAKYKIKHYYRYLKYKNEFISFVLAIKVNDTKTCKALNYACLYKAYAKFNKNNQKNFCLNKALSYCKRPRRKFLILFLLNSRLNFNKLLLIKQFFYVIFRYW